MHKRTISARSGGRKPAVGRETHLQRRFRNCSVDCRPACWRTPLQSRCRKHGGGYAPPLLAVHAFVQRKSRFFNVERTTCTRSGGYQPAVARQAHLQMRYRNCSADCRRCVGERRCSGGSETTGSLRPPPLLFARLPAGGIATFAMYTLPHTRSGWREAAVVIGNRSCQDNSAQIRTPPSREASRAAGVSPPCVALTHLQRRYRHCSENCCRCVGERRCNRVAVTTGAYAARSRWLMCVCAAHKLLFRRRTNAIQKSGGC